MKKEKLIIFYNSTSFVTNIILDSLLNEIKQNYPNEIEILCFVSKQEIWMYENYNKLDRGIMIGIGTGLVYLAVNAKHAQIIKNIKFLVVLLNRLEESIRTAVD